MRVWSGSQALSERLDITKQRRRLSSLSTIVFCMLPPEQSNVHISHTSPPYRSLVLNLINHSCLFQRSTSRRGARVVHCTMIRALSYLLTVAFGFSCTDLVGLFSFCASRSHLSYIWPCHLVFQHGIKAAVDGWIMVVSPKLISH